MIKKFIIRGVSKKFKGVQKLPAQKTPTRFTSVMSDETVKANQRKLLGDLPEFMGLSQRDSDVFVVRFAIFRRNS